MKDKIKNLLWRFDVCRAEESETIEAIEKLLKDYSNSKIEKICDSNLIQKIRATKSDAEARRIIRDVFQI